MLSRLGLTRKSLGGSNLFIFGHFGDINIGNESTLQALLHSLHRIRPGTKITCICTNPTAAQRRYNISAISMNGTVFGPPTPSSAHWAANLGRLGLRAAREVYRWIEAFRALRGIGVLIVAGTGLLTDAYGLRQWGPYTLFKWCILAKLRGGKVLFLSVGAGPLYTRLGRRLVKCALAAARFRSYRDNGTREYLTSIGVPTQDDRVFPDLAFGLPHSLMPERGMSRKARRVVGIGLMAQAEGLTIGDWGDSVQRTYLERLATFTGWLVENDREVRLLIGDVCDVSVIGEFRKVLRRHLGQCGAARVINVTIRSVEDLLSELALTDVVVATRFHNVLLAFLLHKPVIAISFHQKCTSLMDDMGLAQYCEDVRNLNARNLIERFCYLEQNAEELARHITSRVECCRKVLEEQYELIGTDIQVVVNEPT